MIGFDTLVSANTISEVLHLFEWMDKDRFAHCRTEPATLRDNGPAEPLLLDGDPRDEYQRTDIETLINLGFLRREQELKDGEFVTWIKLTDKTDRLLEALHARQDRLGWIWIAVAHEQVFIDEGATPPNLRALIGGEWNPGDRIVITCLNPEYALVRHLPLALAENDPIFIADLREVNEDFKYADAEVDAQ